MHKKGANDMKKIKMQVQNNLIFSEGCKAYLTDCKQRNLRDGTLKHWKEAISNLQKYIPSETEISNMDINTYNNFIAILRSRKNISDMTLYTYSRDLKTLMYFFMRNEWLPTFKITTPKVDKTNIETYTDRELSLLLKKPNIKKCGFSEYKSWVIVNFLLSTGVRQNSLINIKIKDIDFDNSVVYVNITKNRKPLIIPLNQNIIKILKEYLTYRQGNSDDYLFCNIYGNKLTKSTAYHSLYEYNKSRGIETTGIHRFRHTFAKKWVLLGGNVVTLQKILGHSSLAITQNYLNILVSDIKQDIDKFNILEQFNKNTIKIK